RGYKVTGVQTCALPIWASIVEVLPPDSARLFLRSATTGPYQIFLMRRSRGYEYVAAIPHAALREGPHQFVITVFRGDSMTTFPEIGRASCRERVWIAVW